MTENTQTINTESEAVTATEGTEQAANEVDKEISKVGFRDPDQAELELKMVKDIN